MSKSGDKWKASTEPTMSGFYALRGFLLEQLEHSVNYPEAYFDIVETFRPRIRPSVWRNKCIDELVDGYINSDPVFVRLTNDKLATGPYSTYVQVMAAYERGIDYVVRAGDWPLEAREWVKNNVKNGITKEDDDDGN